MRLTIFSGDDDQAIRAQRGRLLEEAGGSPETVDVSADSGESLVGAVCCPNLFGGPRVVAAENIDALGADAAAAIAAAAAGSDAVVVARGGALAPRARKALEGAATFVRCDRPKGRAVAGRIDALAKESGVRLDTAGRTVLAERCADNLERAAAVISQLALAGMTAPTAAQVATLAGSARAAATPWAVTDALEAGDLQKALDAAGRVEAVALVSWLGSRAAQLGRVVEMGGSGDEVAAALGVARFSADSLVRAARRLGPDGVAAMWDVLAGMDRAVKTSRHPEAVIDIALARLACLWRGAPVRH